LALFLRTQRPLFSRCRRFALAVSNTSSLYAWFKSVTALTAITGPFVTKVLLLPSLPFGRRIACFWIALSVVIFWALFFAVNEHRLWLAIIIRGLLGITISAFSALAWMYIVELAPAESTTFFGTIHQLCIAFGLVVIYILASALTWCWTAAAGAGICGLLCGLIWLVPEPSLTSSRSDDDLKEETIFSKVWLCKLVLSITFMLFQQFSGINAILVNLDDICARAGIAMLPSHVSALTANAQVLACLITGAAMQKLGPKTVWIFSFPESPSPTSCTGFRKCHSSRRKWGLGCQSLSSSSTYSASALAQDHSLGS
jgi:SP family sugar:H+ symporter-like MFS transporter